MGIAHSWCSSPIQVAARPGDSTNRGYTKENWCFTDTVLEKNPRHSVDFHRRYRIGLQRCTGILYPDQCDQLDFELFSQSSHSRKSKLLGHVLRAGNKDSTCQGSIWGKRAGRPRQNCFHSAKENTCSNIFFVVANIYICWNSGWGCANIYNAAMTRTYECNTDGTSLDGYVIDFFEEGWRYSSDQRD